MNHNTLTPSPSNPDSQPGDYDNINVKLSDKEQSDFSEIVENNPDLASYKFNESSDFTSYGDYLDRTGQGKPSSEKQETSNESKEGYTSFGDYLEKIGETDLTPAQPTVETVATKLSETAKTETQKINYLHAGREAKKLAQEASVQQNSEAVNTAEAAADSSEIEPQKSTIVEAVSERIGKMSPEELARYTAELRNHIGNIANKAVESTSSPSTRALESSGFDRPVQKVDSRSNSYSGPVFTNVESLTDKEDDDEEPTTILGKLALYFKKASERQNKRRAAKAQAKAAKIQTKLQKRQNKQNAKLERTEAKATAKIARVEARSERRGAAKEQRKEDREQVRAAGKKAARIALAATIETGNLLGRGAKETGNMIGRGTAATGNMVFEGAKKAASFATDPANDAWLANKIKERRAEKTAGDTFDGTETGPVTHTDLNDNPNENSSNFAANMREELAKDYDIKSRTSHKQTADSISFKDFINRQAPSEETPAEKPQA